MAIKYWSNCSLYKILAGIWLFFLLSTISALSQSKLCTGILGDPIISNDFGSGIPLYNTAKINFSTTFTLWNKAATNDGFYSIVNQIPNDFRLQGTNVWLAGDDHTSNDGRGYMMLVNADEKLGQFYKDTVDNLCLGGTYEFSSYLANIFKPASSFSTPVNSIPPKVRFEIRDLSGNIIDSISTRNINNTTTLAWQKYGITFKSPSTSIVLVMVSTASRGTGNDIVLDDIIFRPCTPATISITPRISVCEKGNGMFTVSVQGNADYKYSKWQISRDNGKVWSYLGTVTTQTANSVNYNVDLELNNIPFSDDSALYRLVLSTSESNLANVNSLCNVISPVSLLRVTAYPVLKITDPEVTCATSVNLTNPAIISGSTIGSASLSYFNTLFDATNGTNALSPTQVQALNIQGLFYIKATTNSTPSCSDIKSVNIKIGTPKSLSLSGPSSLCKDHSAFSITATTSNISDLTWTKSGSTTVLQSGIQKTLQYMADAADLDKDSLYIIVSSTEVGSTCPNIKDSIKVKFYNPPTIKLPHDTVFCENMNSLTFSVLAKVTNDPNSISWQSTNALVIPIPSTGNSTALSLANQNTSVKLIGTVSKLGCDDRKDTMEIRFAAIPIADAGADTAFCLGPQFTRSVYNNSLYKYKWTYMENGVKKDAVSLKNFLTFTPVQNTIVSLTIETPEGCSNTDDFIITAISPPQITLPAHLCFKNGLSLTPVVSFVPIGGDFSWLKDNSLLNTSVISNTLNIFQSGNYTLLYKKGTCISSASTTISSPPVLNLADKQACIGSLVNFQAPILQKATYSWNNGAYSLQQSITMTAANFTQTIKLSVKDSLGCTSEISAKLSGVPLPEFYLSSTGVCSGEDGKIDAILYNPSLETSYVLNHSWEINGQMVPSSSWKQINFNQKATYALSLNIGDCKVTNSINSVIFPLPKLQIQENQVYCNENNIPVLLNANFSEGNHYWYVGNQVIGTQSTISVHPDTNTVYLLVVEDKNKCKASIPVSVNICCEPRLFVPNVITPSSSDVNSSLKIFGKYFTNFNLTVFSRWGEVIYATKDHGASWDGNYRNEAMPIGNYAWLVTYEGECPNYKGPYKQVGEVSVVR
ncbi:MAG: gliding motility-associated C-terminal domain-containing protein [Opitutaceae bacterium]|nr:gliding motility-associated C-terminal domain-containing protein [Cytophagales bacterium]